MQINYQERILEKYHSFQAVQDCFAIVRLQTEIAVLSGPAGFNLGPRNKMQNCFVELNKILAKYPDAIEPTTQP